MSSAVAIIFDVAILGALGATIFYAARLSRQFGQMQSDRRAFEILIQSLNTATTQADVVIRSIRDSAIASGEVLQEKTGRARALADELEIIIQAGDSLADRLQQLAEQGRQTHASCDVAPKEEAGEPRTRAEKELLEAIRARQQS